MSTQNKTKILHVIDSYGWAWDIASKDLFRSLPENYVGHILSIKDFMLQRPDTSSFDVVLDYTIYDGRTIKLMNPENIIIGVAGWDKLDEEGMWNSLRRFKYFGACNGKLAERIRRKLGGDKVIWVLSHGVDINQFKPAEKKPEKFVVGWVGNQLRRIKRLSLAQDAVRRVGGAEFRMAGIVGSPEYKEHDTMPDFYRGLSCFLVTSTSEAHSMVVYEAMSAGLPVISTKTGDTDENIVDGVNGFLLEVSWDTSQIVPILTKLRDDHALRERMGNAARQTILDKWSWDKIVPSYMNAYKEVMSRRKR